MLLFFVTLAFSELSDSDIQRIREIVQIAVAAEGKQIRAEMTAAIDASEKRMKEYMDVKINEIDTRINGVEKQINGVEKQITLLAALLVGVMALIVVAIGLP